MRNLGIVMRVLPFDTDQCFWLQDFVPGDCLIITKRGVREKGVVEKTDNGTMEVIYRTATTSGNKVKLDNVVFLKSFDKNWLKEV